MNDGWWRLTLRWWIMMNDGVLFWLVSCCWEELDVSRCVGHCTNTTKNKRTAHTSQHDTAEWAMGHEKEESGDELRWDKLATRKVCENQYGNIYQEWSEIFAHWKNGNKTVCFKKRENKKSFWKSFWRKNCICIWHFSIMEELDIRTAIGVEINLGTCEEKNKQKKIVSHISFTFCKHEAAGEWDET